MKIAGLAKGLLIFIITLCVALWFYRAFSHKEIDDVHPGIPCEKKLLERSDVLWVVPLYENDSISDHPGWCQQILAMNKTLGLHGVYHTYQEFLTPRSVSYVHKGSDVFEKCFGFKPGMFKAPQLALSDENRVMLENQGYDVKGKWNQVFHKVYHCNDSGRFPNWLIRII